MVLDLRFDLFLACVLNVEAFVCVAICFICLLFENLFIACLVSNINLLVAI